MDAQPFEFTTTCVASTAKAINDMTARSRPIKYDAFAEAIGTEQLDQLEQNMGYGPFLRLKDDYHVRFARSWYRGQPCVYMIHSAIEYVFTARMH